MQSQKAIIQGKYSKLSTNPDLSSKQSDTMMASLSELENLAKNANIRIIDIRPQTNLEASSLMREVTIDLKADGEFEGYLKFIYDLENSLSLLRIKRLQLSSKPNSQFLEASFSISRISNLE